MRIQNNDSIMNRDEIQIIHHNFRFIFFKVRGQRFFVKFSSFLEIHRKIFKAPNFVVPMSNIKAYN